jgi:hypothetical protein
MMATGNRTGAFAESLRAQDFAADWANELFAGNSIARAAK